MNLRHLDLFSGIGGFALAAKWAGFTTVGFCEKDTFCRTVLSKNFPDIPIHKDIRDFVLEEDVHLLTAGFPCQPFSQAGNKKGTNDARYLWPELLRIIDGTKAEWIIIENVCGIISMELDNILSDLEKKNYKTGVYVLPACAAHAPHRRDRVWIIAHNNCIRGVNSIHHWEGGSVQENRDRHLEKIQQEWTQLIPDTWTSLTAGDWLQYNRKFSRRDDGVSERLDKDRIKALGNAIVPQVVYPILRFIHDSF